MSVIPEPKVYVRQPPYSLVAFEKVMAPFILQWVRDQAELFWLAPKTEPPLTQSKIVGWPGRTGNPMLLYRAEQQEPLGYLELNPMPTQDGHWWIGHCLLNPALRGQQLGRRMVRMALQDAFINRSLSHVSLVVFPDNLSAIQCYRSVGFVDVGHQRKYFTVTRRQHVMTQMTVSRSRFFDLNPDLNPDYP